IPCMGHGKAGPEIYLVEAMAEFSFDLIPLCIYFPYIGGRHPSAEVVGYITSIAHQDIVAIFGKVIRSDGKHILKETHFYTKVLLLGGFPMDIRVTDLGLLVPSIGRIRIPKNRIYKRCSSIAVL